MSDSDLVVGQLLSLSTHQSPCLAKAWFSLAGWCYKWGRKAVDSARYEDRFKILINMWIFINHFCILFILMFFKARFYIVVRGYSWRT